MLPLRKEASSILWVFVGKMSNNELVYLIEAVDKQDDGSYWDSGNYSA